MLLLSQRADPRVASPASVAPAMAVVVAPPATAVSQPATNSVASRRRADRAAVTPPVKRAAARNTSAARETAPPPNPRRSLSEARVRAVWSKTDTRSLDRALASLRSATLAFQRCDMQMTATDRAVAHCDEISTEESAPARRVAWTFDFRRDAEHWLIDGLSSSRPQTRARR
jgi:hypothetical protein